MEEGTQGMKEGKRRGGGETEGGQDEGGGGTKGGGLDKCAIHAPVTAAVAIRAQQAVRD